MANRTTFALLGAAIMLLSVVAPMAAASDDGELSVSVAQDDGVTVTVADNGTAVPNASVEVTTGENATYDGTGTYETGEDGTVSLATPNESVEVTITATADNDTASTTVTLEAEDAENESENETEESGNASAFGVELNTFLQDTDFENATGPRGLVIANFVVANNPGNVPDHAGPPNASEVGPNGSQGPPEDAGNQSGNGSAGGPPDHAGNDKDDDDDESDDENEQKGGPPEAIDPLGL